MKQEMKKLTDDCVITGGITLGALSVYCMIDRILIIVEEE